VTHRLEVVYLHVKYEKPVLNDKKVTAQTRFVMDPQTSLTLRLKFKVKGHQQWYATHRLEVVYLHAKYAKPVLNDKKVTARTRFVTDAQTDRLITIGRPPQWRGPNKLFVLQYVFFWPLCCLFFFDIQILITPLVSSNSS
jgi:hypothetical protein